LFVRALPALALLAARRPLRKEKLTCGGSRLLQAGTNALFEAIKEIEAKNRAKTRIKDRAVAVSESRTMIPKTVSALDSGNPPTWPMRRVRLPVTAKWAFGRQLEDITGVIDPLRAHFEAAALSTTFLYNDKTKARAYYAFPIKQQTMHIQYWRTCWPTRASRKRHPRTGRAYWSFWSTSAAGLPAEDGNRAFASACRWASIRADSFFSF